MLISQTLSSHEIYVLRRVILQMVDQELRVMDPVLHQMDHDLVPEVLVPQLLVPAAILPSVSKVVLHAVQVTTEKKEAVAKLDLLLLQMHIQ